VSLEQGMLEQTVAGLAEMGHPVQVVRGYARALFGRGQIIRREAETGVLCGGSDPRADGCAMGVG
jgi:gamma-glutamyltranspeptidase/glutathione hydrolase